MTTARALTIAGSDPSGGAGIQQDLKVFHSLGVWGLSAVTAITSQDTTGIDAMTLVDPEMIAKQIAACSRDVGIDAAKTGMIGDRAAVEIVAMAIDRHGISQLVVDPVFVATSGDPLTTEDTVGAMRDLLVPRATVLTPNIQEAEQLTGIAIVDRATQIEAGRALRALGARAVVVTGGHIDEGQAVDVLITDDVEEIAGERIAAGRIHGTGCAFSAAVAAYLARGADIPTAVRGAKVFTGRAIRGARSLGKGGSMIGLQGETGLDA